MNTFFKKLITLILFVIIFLNPFVPLTQAQTSFPNCRLGVGGPGAPHVGGYNLDQLNMGLYLDWLYNSNPEANLGLPADIEYLQVVHVKQAKKNCGTAHCISAYSYPPTYKIFPSLNAIASTASNRPGTLWFIGNEIERRDWDNGDGTFDGQDEITPELYATAFHEIQAVIKTADPTARIGIGSVIFASPLRLKYLDRVWDSYFNQYGYSMGEDIDVWNIHGFILREVRNSWGAEIPAGFGLDDYEAKEGFLYKADNNTIIAEHKNIERFKEFTVALRTWMTKHGERNKPLINTEYGILFKSFGNIPSSDVINYMHASFDYMFNATDKTIGYPADKNRLVQGWVWYSLSDTEFNGNLFNANKTLSAMGTGWKTYVTDPTNPLASQPQKNLLVTNLRTEPEYYNEPPGPVTFTLKADIANSGNTSTDTNDQLRVIFYTDPNDPEGSKIAEKIIDDLAGCGRITTVEVDWENVSELNGEYPWYVKVDPLLDEVTATDNLANSVAYVFNPRPQAELSLTKSVDNSMPQERYDKFNYTIKVSNTGPGIANSVIVNDVLPNGIKLDSYKATQGYYYTSGPWLLGNLPLNGEAILTITAKVKKGFAGQIITNTASISSTDSIDTQSDNDFDSVNIEPLPSYEAYLPLLMKE